MAQIEADITRGKWTDPDAGNVNFGEYADNWLRDRELAARTRERYEGVIRLHLRPKPGKATLAAITGQGALLADGSARRRGRGSDRGQRTTSRQSDRS